jgi:hypothetical protein
LTNQGPRGNDELGRAQFAKVLENNLRDGVGWPYARQPLELNVYPQGGGIESFSEPDSGSATFDFTGNVTALQWIGSDAALGVGGITSLSYTLDGSAPTSEPATLPLCPLGLALVGIAFLRRGTGSGPC